MTYVYLFNEGSTAAIYGIGTYIRQMEECFRNSSEISLHVVNLVSSDKTEFAVETTNGVEYFFVPRVQFLSESEKKRYFCHAWYLICPQIKIEKNDKLIFHLNYYQEYPLIKQIRSKFPKSKIIYTIHYHDWAIALNGNIRKFKQIIHSRKKKDEKSTTVYDIYKNEKQLFKAVDRIVVLGKHEQKILIDAYGLSDKKIAVIPNGLKDEYEPISLKRREELKQKMYISRTEKIILYVGRLNDIKGVDILIKAFKMLLKEYPDSHLYIVGDGTDRTEYQQEAAGCFGKITFTGQLKKEDVFWFYQIADVGVIPSRYEPFGYVALEMMMHGLPLIVADTTGLSGIVENGANGWKVPVKETEEGITISPVALKNKIIKILSGEYDKKKFKPREIFLQKYEVSVMTADYMDLYTK